MPTGLKAVVGLGNPGPAYAGTRHNVGFDVVDRLAAAHGVRLKRSWRWLAVSGTMCISGREVLLVKPQAYVNRSGQSLARLRRRRGVQPEEMLVVVDDVELPPGRIRLRSQGGAGGHNGLKSIITELGSEGFPRLRIGVGPKPPGDEMVDFVLSRFPPEERPAVDGALSTAMEAVECAVAEGVEAAMNRFNAVAVNG